jgi:hypothetical protein
LREIQRGKFGVQTVAFNIDRSVLDTENLEISPAPFRVVQLMSGIFIFIF